MTTPKKDAVEKANAKAVPSSSRKVIYFGIFVGVICLALGARTYLSHTQKENVTTNAVVTPEIPTTAATPTIVDVDLATPAPAQTEADTGVTDISKEDLTTAHLVQATLQLAKSQQNISTTMVAENSSAQVNKPSIANSTVVASIIPSLYQTGGSQVREVLNTITQAGVIEDTYMLELLNQLRVITPRQGPTTRAGLQVMLAQVVRQGAPEGFSSSPAEESKTQSSWWRKQIDSLVKITTGDPALKTLNAWEDAMNAAELLVVLNNVNDAKITLNQAPLKNDARLDNVRQAIDTYLAQQAKLISIQHYVLQSLN